MQCIGEGTWKVQGVEFEAKLRLLPLVAYDIHGARNGLVENSAGEHEGELEGEILVFREG